MDTDEVIAVLRKCGVFTGLSDVELNAIAKLGKIEKFKPGDTLYLQGDEIVCSVRRAGIA